jgi:hypothetical protein
MGSLFAFLFISNPFLTAFDWSPLNSTWIY